MRQERVKRASCQRAFDIAGALGGLTAFSPVMALVCAAILLDDGPPLLFRQERLGLNRHRFTILKFRSMREGRVTRAGRLLRATGLDELPQFVNILRGDMSAVGPRPLEDADVTRLGWSAGRYDFRWHVRPGLTGLAQVMGPPSSRQAASLDRWYVRHRSLSLDLRLIALSVAINVLGKRRVRRVIRGESRWRAPVAPTDSNRQAKS